MKDKASAAALVAKTTNMVGLLVTADAAGGYVSLESVVKIRDAQADDFDVILAVINHAA